MMENQIDTAMLTYLEIEKMPMAIQLEGALPPSTRYDKNYSKILGSSSKSSKGSSQ